MNDLLKHLRRLAKHLNTSIVNPNRGGCCVIAAEIGEHLETIVPVRIRVANDHFDWDWAAHMGDCNLNEVEQELEHKNNVGSSFAWHERDVYFGHVIIEFDYKGRTYHMDTTGVRLAKKREHAFGWLMYDGHLTVKAAKALANQTANWNKRFDRKQIPTIRKMVKQSFAPLSVTPIAV